MKPPVRAVCDEDFQQLVLCFTNPLQYSYEVIRGIMLADETIAARSQAEG